MVNVKAMGLQIDSLKRFGLPKYPGGISRKYHRNLIT
jgi:hypothetical protein